MSIDIVREPIHVPPIVELTIPCKFQPTNDKAVIRYMPAADDFRLEVTERDLKVLIYISRQDMKQLIELLPEMRGTG